MKLHQLRDAIAVADHGSLRAASRKLAISQSAITKSIQLLEKELGVPLFERQKRGVVLTPCGSLFMQRARMATNELLRAKEEIEQHSGDGNGRVTVSMSTVPHMALLPRVLTTFSRRYPNIRLTVVEGIDFANIETQMRNGAIDCFIGVAPPAKPSSEFHVEHLFNNQRWIVARANHPLANAKSVKELVDASWVLPSDAYAATLFAHLFRQHQCAVPQKITIANSVFSQMVFLLNSDMIAISPRQLVELAPTMGHLVRIEVAEIIDAPAVVLIRRAAMPLTPAAEYFCDLIRRASVQPCTSSAASTSC